MHLMGIDFAPLNVPLARRLQTLAVFHHVSMFFFAGIFGTIYLTFLLITPFFWVTWLYVAWYIYDLGQSSRGGRRFELMRRLPLWNWLRDYFPCRIIKTSDLDPTHNYLIGYHPHGLMAIGAFCNLLTEANGFSRLFPGITPYLLSLKLMHYFPLYREYVMSLGVCDVSKESITHIMKGRGVAATIVIGGAREVLDAVPGVTRLTLKNRKGFARMALQTGCHLVPSFSFGENYLFRLLLDNTPGSFTRNLTQSITKKLGVAPAFFVGRGVFNYTFGIMPYRVPVTTVVGSSIEVEHTPDPTQDQVDSLHREYLSQLESLFYAHREACGYPNETLEFIDN
ncbi:hypothetical protein RvY_01169 [Ramazzottius varieornatus]|uniref:Acyltransferase n=1 Tax=Ramazzottius varieornatus TaxID=947166 RepID=A0A1D1UFQ6_RAMVA|nr:hypothetical protein RvY_01169 [Ramazzottius varieornatus]